MSHYWVLTSCVSKTGVTKKKSRFVSFGCIPDFDKRNLFRGAKKDGAVKKRIVVNKLNGMSNSIVFRFP